MYYFFKSPPPNKKTSPLSFTSRKVYFGFLHRFLFVRGPFFLGGGGKGYFLFYFKCEITSTLQTTLQTWKRQRQPLTLSRPPAIRQTIVSQSVSLSRLFLFFVFAFVFTMISMGDSPPLSCCGNFLFSEKKKKGRKKTWASCWFNAWSFVFHA